MRDFKVVQARALLKVISVAPLRGFVPPAILVIGEKLNLADEVLYNGVEAQEYIVTNQTRMVVRIPNSQVGKALSDLRVLAPVPLAKQSALVSLALSKPSKTVDGIDRLVQEWVLTFLTTPGSDIFNPSSGGGGRALVGKSTSSDGAIAQLSLAVDRTRQQLLTSQAKNSKIPSSERLLSASLVNVSFDKSTTTLSAEVEIKNVLGSAAQVTVG